MTCGWPAAIPLTRKAVTLSRCQVSRSSRTSTAILVSNLIGPASVTRPGAVLYVPDMAGPLERVRAWRPPIPGLSEVLHAHFTEHAYPAHVHEEWTVLLVDARGVDYTLGGTRQQAGARRVTVLPPYVSHDGRSASPGGFDKRVLYVDNRWL